MRHKSIRVVAMIFAVGTVSLMGCAFYPKVVDHYDAECHTMRKRLVMEKSAYGMQRQCTNEACIAALVSIPVEAVVVGSVVVVGNTVLWLQKVGNCRLQEVE